jgi:hypothetical protein
MKMADDLAPLLLDEMHDEWQMWQRVVALLKEHGIDVNTHEQLAAAIVLWAEVLVDMRTKQTPEVRQSAFEYAESKWNAAVS